MLYYKSTTLFACGKRGIRTLGTRKGTTVFETVPIDHSGIFPMVYYFRGAKVAVSYTHLTLPTIA